MDPKLPILIIIPHGGYNAPDELKEHITLDAFDLFVQSDTCANEIFDFKENVTGLIRTYTSRLLVDLDRRPQSGQKTTNDGVIKKNTLNEKEIFKKKVFPNELAISNILERYYYPFHNAVQQKITSQKIKLILDCHTAMASAPRNAPHPGAPRPIVQLDNVIEKNGKKILTSSDAITEGLQKSLQTVMKDEEGSVIEKCVHSKIPCPGYILQKFGTSKIPMIRLTISKALFLNDRFFSYDQLKVDRLRINELREKIWEAIVTFYFKFNKE